MDLSTTYLGFSLPHPLMPGASPLADDLDTVRRLEDAGAAAIVMRSLFEEQIELEDGATVDHLEAHADAHVEARSYLPPREAFVFGPHDYLEQLRRIKAAVRVPVIASLNGASPGGWLRYARLMTEPTPSSSTSTPSPPIRTTTGRPSSGARSTWCGRCVRRSPFPWPSSCLPSTPR
jgi:dihydroorotate dehydrogenase (fumarate)